MIEKSEKESKDFCCIVEDNVCPISLIPISELDDPVVCRDSGRIYNRPELIQWIQKYGTDPITKTPLTMEMLASGKFVKQVIIESQHKLQMNVANLMKARERDKEELMSLFNDKFSNFERQMNCKMEVLVTKNEMLKEENMEYKIKLDQLEQNYVNKQWYINGGLKIDNKIEKGCSTLYKANALTLFANNYKKSYTAEQEQKAIEQGQKFRTDPDLKNRNGILPTLGQSESSQLVEEFLKNITINN